MIYWRTGFLGRIWYCTDPAQHLRTAGYNLNVLRGLSVDYLDDLSADHLDDPDDTSVDHLDVLSVDDLSVGDVFVRRMVFMNGNTCGEI